MKRHRPVPPSLWLLTVFGLILLACDLGSITSTKPTVVVAAPPSGSQFHEGENVAVQSTSTDSAGITRVELAADGTIVRTDQAPGAQISYTVIQTWKATLGSHTLTVRAFNSANAASDQASVLITVLPATTPPTPAPTSVPPTLPPAATATVITGPGGCTFNSAFVADVTIPDGTAMASGQAFDKTWRIRNTGTCAWGAGIQLVHVSGPAMTTSTTSPVPATAPNATVDLSVSLTAPAVAGTHTGIWRLKSPSGVLFGSPMSIVIRVSAPPPPTATRTPAAASPTPAPAACSGTPFITSFTASPTNISLGGTATLSWGIVGNAEAAEITPGIGGIATPGSIVVSPAVTTTYLLTARCGSTLATSQVTITVNNSGFAVTAVTTNVNPPSANTCPAIFVFSSIITTNGPGTIRYQWERSDSTASPAQTLAFASAGTQAVTTQWNLGASTTGWARLHILSPNDLTSNNAAFTLACSSSFQVTNVIASVSPDKYSGACPTALEFIGEIATNGAGTVTYRWELSDGANTAKQDLTFTGLGSETVRNQWTFPSSESGWAILHVLAPNDTASSHADYAVQCR